MTQGMTMKLIVLPQAIKNILPDIANEFVTIIKESSVCAYIGIRLQDVSILMQTVDRLKQIPEIVECHFITGTYNLFVKLYCVDNEHLMTTLCDRILAIPGISTTQTYISLNEAFQRQIYVDCLHD